MNRRLFAVLLLLLTAVLAACGGSADTVSGEVTQADSVPMPDGATAIIKIEDTSLADAPAETIGEQIIEDPGSFPFEYEVEYDADDIVDNHTYGMRVRIEDATGSLIFINDTAVNVITNGNPTENVEVPVVAVGGETPLAPTAEPPVEPTEVPVVPVTNTPVPGPETEDTVWKNIEETGVLRVGTSGDYPPFEYYGDDFQLTGFDMALIREIGDRLDLEVNISDFAFDGLGDALLINQIDLAIAALTVTPERARQVRFSQPYFLSSEGVLAQEDSGIVLEELVDLAAYRVGVQDSTVYEQIIQTELVDQELMPQRRLHVYVETTDLISDLADGFIDLAIVDKKPAEVAVEQGDFEIVATDNQRQFYAMAMPIGSFNLIGRVNAALAEIWDDGTMSEFYLEYLGIDLDEAPEIPPDFELPEPPPTEPDECLDGLAFVQDLNLDDNNFTTIGQVPAGQPFQKGWRLKNVGTCDWTPSYTFVYVAGNTPPARMGGQPTAVQAIVSPNQEYELWVDLVAPVYPGTYIGYWQMTNAENQGFGQRVWVAVTVPGIPTPTPLPTQTPTANIQFSANPQSIQQGGNSVLSWATSNVQAVYLYPQGSSWQGNGVEGTGQRTVFPATTTSYDLRVVNRDNSVEIRTVTVFVTPTTGAPNIVRWTADPSQIGQNQCITLQWIVEGSVTKITIARDGTILRDGAPLNGDMQDCPPGTGDKTYTIEAIGPGGVSHLADYVRVNPAATPVPTNTPTPPPVQTPTPPPIEDPVIEYFSVTPSQIKLNDCVNIAWGVSGGADRVQIRRDKFIILDNAAFQGTAGDCPTAAGTYTYAVLATNSVGKEASAKAVVTVSQSVPDNPLLGTRWLLAAIGQGVVAPGSPNITLSFTSQSQLNGSGGCNSYSANYTVDGTSISIGPIITSQIACDEAVMQMEQTYFATLQGATTSELSGGTLLNINSSTGERLQYNALVAAPTTQ